MGWITQLTIFLAIVLWCVGKPNNRRKCNRDMFELEEANHVLLELLAQKTLSDLGLELFNAIDIGDENRVCLLLSVGAPTEYQRGPRIDRPILLAAKRNRVGILELLLIGGANPNVHDSEGLTALHWTSWLNYVDCSKLLLQNGADVNSRDAEGYTPLIRAAQRGHTVTIQLLLDHRANINAVQNLSGGALHVAVKNGKYEAVKLLLKNGADVRQKSKNKKTALSIAIDHRYYEIEQLIRRKLYV